MFRECLHDLYRWFMVEMHTLPIFQIPILGTLLAVPLLPIALPLLLIATLSMLFGF